MRDRADREASFLEKRLFPFIMPYFRVGESAIKILSCRTINGISTIQKSRRKRKMTIPWTWEDVNKLIHQPKEEASLQRAEQTGAERVHVSYYVLGGYC